MNEDKTTLQPGLPFPIPSHAKLWPNKLGFDLGNLEFWQDAKGVRDLDSMIYSMGDTWVTALANLIRNPQDCN